MVVWNTIYIPKAIEQLKTQGEVIDDKDVAALSLLISKHINILGKFSFILPDSVQKGELRELNML